MTMLPLSLINDTEEKFVEEAERKAKETGKELHAFEKKENMSPGLSLLPASALAAGVGLLLAPESSAALMLSSTYAVFKTAELALKATPALIKSTIKFAESAGEKGLQYIPKIKDITKDMAELAKKMGGKGFEISKKIALSIITKFIDTVHALKEHVLTPLTQSNPDNTPELVKSLGADVTDDSKLPKFLLEFGKESTSPHKESAILTIGDQIEINGKDGKSLYFMISGMLEDGTPLVTAGNVKNAPLNLQKLPEASWHIMNSEEINERKQLIARQHEQQQEQRRIKSQSFAFER